MAFGYYNNDLAGQVKNSLFNTNNNTFGNYDSINNALINATKGYFNQKPKQDYLWENEREYFPKHKFDKPVNSILPNYILGKEVPINIVQMYKNGGRLTKYSDLSDKDRWKVIRAGVKAGYTSIDDIEKAYNEYAKGGSLKQDDYYNNVLLQKDSNQKQYIKEQLEKRKTYSLGGNISHKFGDGSNIYGYSENNDALTFYKDVDDIYVTPNGNYYQGEEFNKRKQQDIIADINNNPALLFRPEYSKWYNYNRTEAKKQGWDFDETMSTMFNRLPFESQEWIVQNNPSAFRLLPQNVQSDYITRTKGMRPGALQRLVDDAGENFLGKSVNNAVIAASLISLPTALKSGRLIKSGIDKVADVGYKALNSTNVGRNATNFITKAVLPAVETKWVIEGAMNLPSDIGNTAQAIREGDYFGAALEGVNTAFDASMIPVGMKNIPNVARGVKNEVGNVVQSVKNKTNNNPNIQFIRGMNTVPEIRPDGTFSLSPEENLFTNFTSDLPMIPHKNYKNAPTNTLFFDQSSIKGVRPLSIEPMDNIALNSEVKLTPQQVRFVSPNPEQMELAKQRGFIVDEWPQELKDLYSQLEKSKQLIPAKKSGTITINPEHYEYNEALQKAFSDKYNDYLKTFYRRPTYKDYQLLEKQTKLQSKVKEDANIKEITDYLKKVKKNDIIPSNDELISFLGKDMAYQIPNNELTISMKHIPDFENVVYDIAPTIEYDLAKSFGIPAHPKIKDGNIYSHKKTSSDISYEEAMKQIENYLKDKGTFKYGGNIYETKDSY